MRKICPWCMSDYSFDDAVDNMGDCPECSKSIPSALRKFQSIGCSTEEEEEEEELEEWEESCAYDFDIGALFD